MLAMRTFCSVVSHRGLVQQQILTKVNLNASWLLLCRQKPTPCYSQVRNIMKDVSKTILKPKHSKDRLSKDYEFIYGSSNINYMNFGMPVMISSVIFLGVFMTKVLYDHHVLGKKIPGFSLLNYHADDVVLLAYAVIVLSLVASIYLARFYKSMVLRMYYHAQKDQYVCILYRVTGTKQLHFTAADVKFHEKEPRQFAGQFEIKGQHYFINLPGFVKMNHYNRLVGYDTGVEKIEQLGGVLDHLKHTYKDFKEKSKVAEDLYSQKKRKLKK